tara:strand:+ start:385 stop:627 length:243 start_codon:yes stop_codon:yes gene_type:complete
MEKLFNIGDLVEYKASWGECPSSNSSRNIGIVVFKEENLNINNPDDLEWVYNVHWNWRNTTLRSWYRFDQLTLLASCYSN